MTASRPRLGWKFPSRRVALLVVLAGGLLTAVLSLVWLAYRAVGEWRRSTVLLVEQRSEEALTLLTVALSRDMKGVHDSILGSFNESALNLERSFELEDLFGQAFARFPYPESFFVWRDSEKGGTTIVFNRVDRPPRWAQEPRAGAYPVVSLWNTPVGSELAAQTRRLGDSSHRFGAFDTTILGERYQVVVHLLYHTTGRRELFGAVGFTVNHAWVREQYFHEILRQISAIGNIEGSISLSVSDDAGAVVASTGRNGGTGGALYSRPFPLSFLDPDLIQDVGQRADPPWALWTASVSAADDETLAAAVRGSSRILWLVVIAASAVIIGVAFTVRAIKASADLANMQSEFIASATHELKTPLAVFNLVAETLMKGRYQSTDTIRRYAGMLSDQTHLLERLIDNLLAYGALGHVARYNFQPTNVSEIVESALERFDARLAATGIDVKIDLPAALPRVLADRQSLLQVFENVIDNAIKYSPQGESLTVKGAAVNGMLKVEIADHGVGIPESERDKVFEKFYRGRTAGTVRGSGLGLAIARRVVEDHGGRIELHASEPTGTSVEIRLPVAS